MANPPTQANARFHEDYHDNLHALRTQIADLLSHAGVLHSRPQDIGREFGINKNLAWKISKLVHEEPCHETLNFIPGPSGFRIFLAALVKYGLPKDALDTAEAAYEGFQAMAACHAGDRPTLQLLLDSLAAEEGDGARLNESRRLAFQGNSGILGIQARVRFMSFFAAPNPQQPDMLDTAMLGGVLGLRRFRSNASWILSRNSSFSDDDTKSIAPNRIPLDPRFSGPGPSLLGDYSDMPIPKVTARNHNGMELFELSDGPIGNTGVENISFGHYSIADLPRYCDEHNQKGEFHFFLASPVETLHADIILHKDLGVVDIPNYSMPLNLHQSFLPAQSRTAPDLLPMAEKPRRIFGARPIFSTPLIERYGDMTDLVFERLGWNPEEFLAWRFEINYPPLPATLIVSFPLQSPPTA